MHPLRPFLVSSLVAEHGCSHTLVVPVALLLPMTQRASSSTAPRVAQMTRGHKVAASFGKTCNDLALPGHKVDSCALAVTVSPGSTTPRLKVSSQSGEVPLFRVWSQSRLRKSLRLGTRPALLVVGREDLVTGPQGVESETSVGTSEARRERAGGGWAILTAILVALILGSLAVIIILGNLLSLSSGWWTAAIATLTLSVPLHIWTVSYRPARLRKGDQFGGNGHLHHQELLSKASEYIRAYSQDMIRQYVEALEKPWELRSRIVETIQPRSRAIRQKVSINLDLSDSVNGSIIFPVMFPEKGELQDDFNVTLDDSYVATYTHTDYLLLTVGVLNALIERVLQGLKEQSIDLEKINEFKLQAERGTVLVAMRSRLNKGGIATLNQCRKTIKEITELPNVPSDVVTVLKSIASIMSKLAAHYAILILVPTKSQDPDGRVRRVVEYERYQIPNLELARFQWWNPISWLRWARDRLGMLLGARPIHLRLSVANAATTASYHLLVFGPEGTYVGVQDMPPMSGAVASGQQGYLGEKVDQPYRRFQRRRGQRYLHVYMRFVRSAITDRMRLSVLFYEIPPGSMASATAAAGAAFLLTYVVAWITGAGGPPSIAGASFGTDFPAIVLSFPAIVGAFAGFESRSTGIGTGTLASRTSSLVTIICSLWATALFVAQSTTKIRYAPHESLLGVADRWWQVLVLINLANLLYIAYVWTCRTFFYYFLSHRPTVLSKSAGELK